MIELMQQGRLLKSLRACLLVWRAHVAAILVFGGMLNCVYYDDRPFRHAYRLAVWEGESSPETYLHSEDWEGRSYFEDVAGFAPWSLTLQLEGRNEERLQGLQVSAGFFKLLDISPILGRTFAPREADLAVAVIGEDLWRTSFDASPQVIGRRVQMEGRPYVILGVLAKWQTFPQDGTQVWTLLAPSPQTQRLHYVGLLRLERSFEEADQAIANIRLRRFSEEAGRH